MNQFQPTFEQIAAPSAPLEVSPRQKWEVADELCRAGPGGMLTYHAEAFDEGVASDQRLPQVENSSDAWISVTDRLPSTELLPNGDAPVVLAAWKKGVMADNLLQVSTTNTTFLALRVSDFTHWMPVPAVPKLAEVSRGK